MQLTLTDARGRSKRHIWLRFVGQIRAAAPRPDGKPAKDRGVQIVVPADVPDAFLQERMPGRIYNYLPTDILTGLPFQINGDFYPATDRKNIDNDHPNHRHWNEWVVKGLGECLADALPALIKHFRNDPRTLYQWLDLRQGVPLVEPIVERFYEAARPLPLFATVGDWRTGAETR